MKDTLQGAPLGQGSHYENQYNPDLLFSVARAAQREEIGLESDTLPFKGEDVWYAFELSWLNQTGKPEVALARIAVPCESEFLIESKSLKLYFNAFNATIFKTLKSLEDTIIKDLSNAAQANVKLDVLLPENFGQCSIATLPGSCIDGEDIVTQQYTVDSALLSCSTTEVVAETLHSNLLKSNCLATGQPDWGSVVIDYEGPKLDRAALLKYIISFREHQEFHEHCVERIFTDIHRLIKPARLTVYARYTRRGGLDINPIRSTEATLPNFAWSRLARQ